MFSVKSCLHRQLVCFLLLNWDLTWLPRKQILKGERFGRWFGSGRRSGPPTDGDRGQGVLAAQGVQGHLDGSVRHLGVQGLLPSLSRDHHSVGRILLTNCSEHSLKEDHKPRSLRHAAQGPVRAAVSFHDSSETISYLQSGGSGSWKGKQHLMVRLQNCLTH